MFKSDAGVWTEPDGGSKVDVSTGVVVATTTHFSEWGVFGDENSLKDGSSASRHSVTFGWIVGVLVACLAILSA